MSVRADGTNSPLRRSEKKIIEGIRKRVGALVKSGVPKDQAEVQARKEARE